MARKLLQEKRGQRYYRPGAGRYSPLMSAARWGHNEVREMSRDAGEKGVKTRR